MLVKSIRRILNQKARTTHFLVNIEKIGCTFLERMMVKHALIMKRVVFIKIFDWNVRKDLEFDTVLQSVSTRQFRPWFLKIEKYACQIFEGLFGGLTFARTWKISVKSQIGCNSEEE